MENKKYIIYENDLKFRNSRNLDINKIDWEKNDIKNLYEKNHDTIEYRIEKSIKDKYYELDLEEIGIDKIPDIIYSNNFINIKYLFLSNNNLSGRINLFSLKKIELVNIDNNKITNIILPENILEFSANNNLIDTIPKLNNIKRLRLSQNNIKEINNINNDIEILELDNNNINKCDLSRYNKLKRVILFKNPIEDIIFSDSIKYIDISETKIKKLNNINKIEHLVLNSCSELKEITKSNYLKILEIINTPIYKLNYYKNFELILIQLNLTKNISSRYKEVNAKINIKKNILLVISKEDMN